MKRCLKCQAQYEDREPACPRCQSTSFLKEGAADLLNAMARETAAPQRQELAPGAKQALRLAVVGFFIAGIFLGPLAVMKASEAKRAIAANPGRYTGGDRAQAALILGIVDIVLFVTLLLLKLYA